MMNWKYITQFDKLEPIDLYNFLKLRQDIFIIEQNCIYDDIDSIDQECEHLMLYENDILVAYSRIAPEKRKFDCTSIGRIVVNRHYRGKGVGRQMIKKVIQIIQERGEKLIKIEAQEYLQNFYESLDFIKISDPYDVDGIKHIAMKLNL